MNRYHLRILSNRQGEFIIEEPKSDGDWVKSEDVDGLLYLVRFIVNNKRNFTIGDTDGMAGDLIDRLAEYVK